MDFNTLYRLLFTLVVPSLRRGDLAGSLANDNAGQSLFFKYDEPRDILAWAHFGCLPSDVAEDTVPLAQGTVEGFLQLAMQAIAPERFAPMGGPGVAPFMVGGGCDCPDCQESDRKDQGFMGFRTR